jgi:cell division septum initiation protein DivIVA
MIQGRTTLWTVWGVLVGTMLAQGMVADTFAGAEKLTKEARETVEATKEYTVQQKEAFQRKAQEELAAVQGQISALRGKTREVSAAARAEIQKSIDELEKQKDVAKDKLDTLRTATDAKWNEMKTRVDTAFDEVKRSYQKVLSRLP